MNRYAALGLALDADQGKRILIITPKAAAIRHAMEEFSDLPEVLMHGTRFRLTNGDQRIPFPSGGSIIFRPAGGTVHGYAAHVVFLDEGTDARLTLRQREDLALTLATTGGDIVRA